MRLTEEQKIVNRKENCKKYHQSDKGRKKVLECCKRYQKTETFKNKRKLYYLKKKEKLKKEKEERLYNSDTDSDFDTDTNPDTDSDFDIDD